MNIGVKNNITISNLKKQINWHLQKPKLDEYFSVSMEFDNKNIPQYGLPKRNLIINFNSHEVGTLPYNLKDIYDEIQESKYILEFDDDWDDEGSPSYKESTWETAVKFLINLVNMANNKIGFIIPTPKIYHSSDGSIDILWENEQFRFLINFPDDVNTKPSFYGDNYMSKKVEGSIDDPQNINPGIFLLLMDF